MTNKTKPIAADEWDRAVLEYLQDASYAHPLDTIARALASLHKWPYLDSKPQISRALQRLKTRGLVQCDFHDWKVADLEERMAERARADRAAFEAKRAAREAMHEAAMRDIEAGRRHTKALFHAAQAALSMLSPQDQARIIADYEAACAAPVREPEPPASPRPTFRVIEGGKRHGART